MQIRSQNDNENKEKPLKYTLQEFDILRNAMMHKIEANMQKI